MRSNSKKRQAAILAGWRSGFEEDVAAYLTKEGVAFRYEEVVIEWLDMKNRKYTPDFELSNGILIETKGRFVSNDRRKHVEIKKQRPDLDIRFVFQNSNSKLYKGAKSTYGDWCKKQGFLYADKVIPREWLEEKKTK